MEFSLENPGFVTPTDPGPAASPGLGAPLPPSASSSSSASLLASGSARRQCQQCHRRISKPVYGHHTFCTCCRGVDCSFDSLYDECTDSLEEMEACVKHRRSLKSKDLKGKDPLPRPPPPSVPSSRPAVVSVDDVDSRIARSFTSHFNDLSSFLRNSFNQLSKDVTARISVTHPSFTAPPEVSVPDRTPSQDPSPHPPVATVGHHREFQVQGGGDREPQTPVLLTSIGESLDRGRAVREPVQAPPVVLVVSARVPL